MKFICIHSMKLFAPDYTEAPPPLPVLENRYDDDSIASCMGEPIAIALIMLAVNV